MKEEPARLPGECLDGKQHEWFLWPLPSIGGNPVEDCMHCRMDRRMSEEWLASLEEMVEE